MFFNNYLQKKELLCHYGTYMNENRDNEWQDFKVSVKFDRRTGVQVEHHWEDASGAHGGPDGVTTRCFDRSTGRLVREVWGSNPEARARHGDEPKYVDYDPATGKIICTGFLDNDERQAQDLPSVIHYNANGDEIGYEWRSGGAANLHRSGDKPAVVHLDPEISASVAIREEYWENGDIHRTKGPAVIVRDPLTGECQLGFYVNGEAVEPDKPGQAFPEPLAWTMDFD